MTTDKAAILFVDDEPNMLSALRRALRKEPYQCFFAEGPEEGLDLIDQESIDLVVADHMMPGMDGLTFLKRLREINPEIIRVILTGQADLQMAMEAINEGEVSRFLTKPWIDVELRMVLKQLVDFIELRRENQTLMDQVRRQQAFIERLSDEHPNIFDVERDATGAIVIDLEELETNR
jgi:two-component system probable response regulator PhcQ